MYVVVLVSSASVIGVTVCLFFFSMIHSGSVSSSSGAVGSGSAGDSNVECDIPLGIPAVNLVSAGPIRGSEPTFLLQGGVYSNPKSSITLDKLVKIRKKYNIPIHIRLHAPSEEVRADWDIPGMVCLYELPFASGFRFPLPRLVTDICHLYCISPGQLMPNAWRVLMALEVLSELRGIDFSLDEVLYAFYLKEGNKDDCRFQLNARLKRCPPLLQQLKDCSKTWKQRFFFVPFNLLGLPSDSHVSRKWSDASE